MAGDWIKMRIDLSDDPAVIGMACALGVDEYSIVGRLHKLWSWADKHCDNGHAKSVTFVWIDRYVCLDSFSECMSSVGWLQKVDGGILFPHFDRHNGKSAKVRADATERKRKERKEPESDNCHVLVTEMSQDLCDKSVTREEKRREDNTTTPIPPNGGLPSKKRIAAISFPAFIAECKENGKTPIPEDASVFEYADNAGLSRDMLRLQWLEFKDRYSEPGAKKYKAWPSVFCKSVRGNWFKLWFNDKNGNGFVLTTTGTQAENTHRAKQ
jgi:hypothetical protein